MKRRSSNFPAPFLPAATHDISAGQGPLLISSRLPHGVALLCALVSVLCLSPALQDYLAAAGRINWLLLLLSAAHGLAALFCLLAWKTVRVGEDGYAVTDLFRSERIGYNDVCMAVAADGLFWNRVTIHFARPTCYGWRVSFVPAGIAAADAAARCRSLKNGQRRVDVADPNPGTTT